MAQAMRTGLLGRDPPVELSRRAVGMLARLREEWGPRVDEAGMVLEGGEVLWTFAGEAVNRSLVAALNRIGVDARGDSLAVRCDRPTVVAQVRDAGVLLAGVDPPMPAVDQRLLDGLKFSVALPVEVAREELQVRSGDSAGAVQAARGRVVVR